MTPDLLKNRGSRDADSADRLRRRQCIDRSRRVTQLNSYHTARGILPGGPGRVLLADPKEYAAVIAAGIETYSSKLPAILAPLAAPARAPQSNRDSPCSGSVACARRRTWPRPALLNLRRGRRPPARPTPTSSTGTRASARTSPSPVRARRSGDAGPDGRPRDGRHPRDRPRRRPPDPVPVHGSRPRRPPRPAHPPPPPLTWGVRLEPDEEERLRRRAGRLNEQDETRIADATDDLLAGPGAEQGRGSRRCRTAGPGGSERARGWSVAIFVRCKVRALAASDRCRRRG